MKIASNSRVFRAMPGDMDIDAGVILDGVELSEVGNQVIDFIKRVANGEQTAAEKRKQGGMLAMYTYSRTF